jgi:hypothetical protein
LGYGDLSGLPTLAATDAGSSHHFLTSYTSTTGAFTDARPSAADLSDTATSAGYVLRANGTSFVSAQLGYGDLSGTPTLPTFSTANQGIFWGPGIVSPTGLGVSNYESPVASANTVQAYQFVLLFTITISHITFAYYPGVIGNHVGFGIYSADGTTKLVDTGAVAFTSNTGGSQTTTISPVTLSPGVYWFAQTGDTTAAILVASPSSAPTTDYNYYYWNNASVHPKSIVAGNASTGGALPSSLGTLTAASNTNNVHPAWVGFES